MSDEEEAAGMEEDDIPTSLKPPSERIYFGSLEDQERKRLEKLRLQVQKKGDEGQKGGDEGGVVLFEPGEKAEEGEEEEEEEEEGSKDEGEEVDGKEKDGEKEALEGIDAALAVGNIQKVGPGAETYELSAESRRQKELQEQKYQDLLMKRRARAMAVPTNPDAVRQRLRELGEPVTLFGEREMERRDRLREILVKLEAAGELDKLISVQEEEEEGEEEEEEAPVAELFYTEGSAELMHARGEIAQYSLPRAKERISSAKRKRESPDEDEDEEIAYLLKSVAETSMQCSEIGDERPVSGCAFSPDASLLATCSWSGVAKLWSVPSMTKKETLKGHTERITDIAFHPRSCLDLDATAGNVATASADKKAILWSLDGKQLRTFEGHLDRLARLAFHPSGKYLGTASFDRTWRLWDLDTGIELLLQEGHARSVYALAFHPDGSLAASAGLDALARVWDLRSGRSILAFEGHVKGILGVDFSPNGYHMATASEDHTCRVWDLRKRGCLYIIPAHSSLLSQVRYEPRDGFFLVTGSYDNSARVWSGQDFKPVKTLAGHEGKVMGVDVAPDGGYVATVSYDRTIKLWSHDSRAMDEGL